jgi:hypothetical protein
MAVSEDRTSAGDAADIKPGEKVKLHGTKQKKQKGTPGNQQFLVERVTKNFGRCEASTSATTQVPFQVARVYIRAQQAEYERIGCSNRCGPAGRSGMNRSGPRAPKSISPDEMVNLYSVNIGALSSRGQLKWHEGLATTSFLP